MRDINYNVRRVVLADGSVVYRAYENNNPLEDFMTEQQAWLHLMVWQEVMR